MSGTLQVLLVVGVIAVVIAVAVLAYHQQKKRREALAALAAKLGWAFDPGHDHSHDDLYGQFGCFRRGHSRSAYNTLHGTLEIDGAAYPARMGDFMYKVTTGSGKNRRTTTYRFSYLIVHVPYQGVPDLLIRREGFFDKIAGALGFDDIDFESEEFSRKFHVKCRDKKFAYDVVHPRMMEFLMSRERGAIEVDRGVCCITDGSRCWAPEAFEGRLVFVREFFDLWPDYLVRGLRAERSGTA